MAMGPSANPRGRANRGASRAHTGEAVARAARERSEQEREWHRCDARNSHLFALALSVPCSLEPWNR